MSNSELQPVVIITGPTAIGKSALAIKMAQRFQGEIISADSRQVYREMDIATAKPEPAEIALVPHHLINIVQPDEVVPCPIFRNEPMPQSTK